MSAWAMTRRVPRDSGGGVVKVRDEGSGRLFVTVTRGQAGVKGQWWWCGESEGRGR